MKIYTPQHSWLLTAISGLLSISLCLVLVTGNAGTLKSGQLDGKNLLETQKVPVPQYIPFGRFMTDHYQTLLLASKPITKEIRPAQKLRLDIQPGPEKNVTSLTIEHVSSDHIRISVLNMVGQTMIRKNIWGAPSAIQTDVDLANLPGGAYFLKVEAGKSTIVRKVIKV